MFMDRIPAMRIPPRTRERTEEGELPYPIETLRFWYVSPFGGRSEGLASDQVGLNRQALAQNTELEPNDRVAVGLEPALPSGRWGPVAGLHLAIGSPNCENIRAGGRPP